MLSMEGRCLVAAAVLHLALPVAAAIAPVTLSRPLAGKSAMIAAELEIDVALERVMTPDEEREREPAGEGSAVPAAPLRDKRDERRDQQVRAEDREDEPPIFEGPKDSETTFDAEPPLDHDADPMKHAPEHDGLGSAGFSGLPLLPGMLPPPDSGPREPAPTKTRKREYDQEQARRAIDGELRQRDADLGLDLPAASAIGAVLRDQVRAAETPDECNARFVVTLAPSGKVTNVALLSSSGGDGAAWQSVQSKSQALLKARSFTMRASYDKGALVTVRVTSSMKMPGGGASRVGAGMSFDVADLGARPIRVVTMHASARPIE